MTKMRGALSCGVALSALLAAGGALAGDFTVPSGVTETDTQVLSDPGDVGLIEAGGVISTVGNNAPGVSMENVDQSVTNNGDVTTLGTSAFGIVSSGDGAQIDNNGDITTSGASAEAIVSEGADARIDNSGDITTSGNGGHGISSDGNDARINNIGNITTEGFSAIGIRAAGQNALIDNSGDIITKEAGAAGIDSNGADARIDNSGNINTEGGGAEGIASGGINARIDNIGDITTSGANAAGILSTFSGADAEITNSGDITTSGQGARGITSGGINARIDNIGDITTSGVTAYGIFSAGADALITNGGSIITSGGGARAIQSTGQGARIDNIGSIATSGNGGYGISSEGADALIANKGSITTTAANGGYGILSVGANARIDNSGGITTTGPFGDGIHSEGANALIINSGAIMTPDGQGIVSLAATPTVTNSGRIIASLNTYAIFFAQQNATLNLLAGSVIQGGIGFSNAEVSATLNIGPGLNMVMSFADVPGTINTFGAPMVVQGPLVAVVDPTGFSAQDEMLTDLTRAIANAVDGRINAARFGYSPPATPLLSYAEADGAADAQTMALGYPAGSAGAASSGNGFWVAGIGAYRNQEADGADTGFDTGLGGLLVGLDGELANGMRVGGFIGASASRFETNGGSQEIDADSYFGGVYGSYAAQNYFLDLSLTGGVSRQSSDRTVANNLVLGGIEHATADYDGVFVSPSATIGTSYAMSGGMLIPSLRARYAGLFLDGYDESGSAADMTVEDRDVNIFDLRAQLAYALASKPVGNGSLHTAFRFGADATFADNDNVEAVLLGTGLNFSVSGDDTLRGFAGVDLSWQATGGSSFFLSAEAGYDSGDAFTLDVLGGLRIPL